MIDGRALLKNSKIKNDYLILLFFSLLIILTRTPFMSKFLYDWDSINFALAFKNFNISLSQPQPPGYIFFVGLGRFLNSFFQDPNSTMIFMSIVFSILTVILVYLLSKKIFSTEIGIISSLLLIFNPIFWFYGEIASIYACQGFFATLIAFLSYKAMKKNSFAYISALVLGLAGRFRQDVTVLMFPLWLFCISYERFELKKIVVSLFIVILSSLTWFLSTVQLSGGYNHYSNLTKYQLTSSFNICSVFFGADILNHIIMLEKLALWTLNGLGIAGIFSLLFLVLQNPKNIIKSVNFKSPKVIFFILWILPSFGFFALVFIAKSGYTLIYLPGLTIIIGFIISKLSENISFMSSKKFLTLIMAFFIIFNTVNFVLIEKVDIESADQKYVEIVAKNNSHFTSSIKVNTIALPSDVICLFYDSGGYSKTVTDLKMIFLTNERLTPY
nr:glycosyltransferase family 39 protein [uncultured Methanobacterium sp.]